jgi:anhydro-N-acetylmuramic acid kinase
MYEATRNVLGLMSGTSLDGMDAAIVRFEQGEHLDFKLLDFFHFPYPEALKILAEKTFFDRRLLPELEERFADWTVSVIRSVQDQSSHAFDVVGSHGQTVFHDPLNKSTVQAGNLPRIARETGCTLVTNFRIQDVLLGGQGAPLVPFGDHRLFGGYEAALNLGGFANVSIGEPFLRDGVHAAFDVCAVNRVLNVFAAELGQEYDRNGDFAREGAINAWVLEELDSLAYYEQAAPKSLGSEWVESTFLPLIDYLAPKDALATAVEHIAQQIVEVLGSRKTLVSGGGAFNGYLIQRMRMLGADLHIPDKTLVEAKESVIFALLAHERIQGRPNVIGSTTGSGIWHSSGSVFAP